MLPFEDDDADENERSVADTSKIVDAKIVRPL